MAEQVDVQLLQEYAGRAMQGMLASPNLELHQSVTDIARVAYEYAQAMCEEDGRLRRERIAAERQANAAERQANDPDPTPDHDVHLLISYGPDRGLRWCPATDGLHTYDTCGATCTDCIDRYREHAS